MISRANAVFGISTAAGHVVDLAGIGPAIDKERHGTLYMESRQFADGSSMALGGLVSGPAAPTLMHGTCAKDFSEAKDLKAALSRCPSGEFAVVADWTDSVLAARDPLGAKPLFQGTTEGLAVVSTEASLITAFGIAPVAVRPGYLLSLKGGTVSAELYAPPISRKAFSGNLSEATSRVGELLKESLKVRLGTTGSVAVAFSGGLDSSVLATACSKRSRVLLVSVFAEGSHDEGAVGPAAEELGLELLKVKVGRGELESALAAIPGGNGLPPMDRSLSAGFFLASGAAAGQGMKLLLAGQGADEIFGGYSRHLETAKADPSKLLPQLVDELPRLEVGLTRDELAIALGGCEASFPYADFPLAKFVLNLPHNFLIAKGERKLVLKELARRMDLAGAIISSPKKAFQYSSGIQDLLR